LSLTTVLRDLDRDRALGQLSLAFGFRLGLVESYLLLRSFLLFCIGGALFIR
jgi:hypothetical protein